MPERIAKVAQTYADRRIKPGATFDVEQRDVAVLLTLGRIEPIDGEAGYVARDLTAAAPPKPYATRDMAAASPRQYRRKGGTQ